MCDDFSQDAEDEALACKGLSRRDFAVMGAAAAMVACSGGQSEARSSTKLTEGTVRITTPDGTADAFFVHPARGAHPGVVMWPDIVGLREAKKVMARRLAGAGYAVLLINHYYRSAPAPFFATFAEGRTPEGQERLKPAIAQLSPEGTMRDAAAFVAWLDTQPAVDKRRKIGSNGYCQTGSFTVRTAAAVPARVGAAASFHGGGLVGTTPDSPSQLLASTQASFLIAIARNDDQRAPGDKDALRAAAQAAGRPAEIEVYQGDHGWTVLDSPQYNQAEADRAWARMLALYAKL